MCKYVHTLCTEVDIGMHVYISTYPGDFQVTGTGAGGSRLTLELPVPARAARDLLL